MGVMEKFRESTKYILWVLIISFGLLWGLSDTRVFDAMMAGPQSLGEVNGTQIGLEEYNQRVQYYIQQHNNRTNGNVNPEMRAYYEDQAWQDLVANKLLQQKMEELGITVTDAELVDMITGENPDPFIRQQFAREDGTIDRAALQQAIQAKENTQVWVMIEQQLRQKRRQQKMNNFIESGLIVSETEVEETYVDNNSFADVSLVRFPYSEIESEDIVVSDEEIQTYYNENREDFERKESYRFQYVSFSKAPTAEDTARTIKEVEELKEPFANAENDSLFLAQNQSASTYNNSFVKESEIREPLKPVLELQEGKVSDVIVENGRVHLLKLIERRGDEVKFADFQYNITADPIATIDEQAGVADDFTFFAQEDGFEKEAERRSLEIQNAFATKGQPFIAGIGQSRQVIDFLERDVSEGEISDPIELTDQFVVIKVTEIIPEGPRPLNEVQSQIVNKLRIEKRKDAALQNAREFAGNNTSIEAIAQAAGKEVINVETVRKSSSVITDVGREPKIVGNIFGMDPGEISNPIPGNNAVYVVKVNSIELADPAEITGAQRQQIRQQLRQQKMQTYMQVWIQQLKKEADIEDYRHLVFQS